MNTNQTEENESYEYVRAIADCGELRWEYKISGNDSQGSMSHDEPVDDYSEDDIRDLTVSMLDIPDDKKEEIEIIYR